MKQVSTITGIVIIIAAAVVLVGGAFGYQYFAIQNANIKNQNDNVKSQNETANSSFKALATADWKTYRNDKYGFEFKYPKEYEVTIYPAPTFQNTRSTEQGYFVDLYELTTERQATRFRIVVQHSTETPENHLASVQRSYAPSPKQTLI